MRDGGSVHHPGRVRQESKGKFPATPAGCRDWEEGVLLSQVRREDGGVQVVARAGTEAYELATGASLYDLVLQGAAGGQDLKALVLDLGLRRAVDVRALCDEGRMLPPILHPDPARLHITGTAGPQRERFQPATGDVLVGPGAPVTSPVDSDEGASEAGIAGIHVIAPGRCAPPRVGFRARQRLLRTIRHTSRTVFRETPSREPAPGLVRGRGFWSPPCPPDRWQDPHTAAATRSWPRFPISGPARMPCRHGQPSTSARISAPTILLGPGDVHVHIFAAASLSLAPGFALRQDDLFETEAAPFGLPLWNPLSMAASAVPLPQSVHAL